MRKRRVVTGAVAALLAVVAGCGSDETSTVSTSTTAATTSPSQNPPPDTRSGETLPSPATVAATTTLKSVDDKAMITAAFTTFFDGADPSVDHKVAVLEGGEALRSMLDDAAANPQFQQLSTIVNSVELSDDAACATAGEQPPCALVVHDLFVGGLPAMVNINSHAVRDGSTWKVSTSSWCAIVKIGGSTCPQSP